MSRGFRSRDSPLTAHGVLQARRLAAHLAARAADDAGRVRRVFSSDLCRAVETARAVAEAQAGIDGDGGRGGADGAETRSLPLEVIQLAELRERDFGSAEGKKYGVGAARMAADAESREEMRARAERFVRGHLVPLFMEEEAAAGGCVIVVSHGLILGSLLRVLLAWLGPGELARLEHPGAVSWGNTGYVELVVAGAGRSAGPEGALGVGSGDRTPASPMAALQQRLSMPRVTLSVVAVNVLKHLEGLKKTRGGIGSAQFDKRQRTMDSFFGPAAKKPKVERGSAGP